MPKPLPHFVSELASSYREQTGPTVEIKNESTLSLNEWRGLRIVHEQWKRALRRAGVHEQTTSIEAGREAKLDRLVAAVSRRDAYVASVARFNVCRRLRGIFDWIIATDGVEHYRSRWALDAELRGGRAFGCVAITAVAAIVAAGLQREQSPTAVGTSLNGSMTLAPLRIPRAAVDLLDLLGPGPVPAGAISMLEQSVCERLTEVATAEIEPLELLQKSVEQRFTDFGVLVRMSVVPFAIGICSAFLFHLGNLQAAFAGLVHVAVAAAETIFGYWMWKMPVVFHLLIPFAGLTGLVYTALSTAFPVAPMLTPCNCTIVAP